MYIHTHTDIANEAVESCVPAGFSATVVRRPRRVGKVHFPADRPRLVRCILGHNHCPGDQRPFRYHEQRGDQRCVVRATPIVVQHTQPAGLSGRPSDQSLELDQEVRVST